MKFGRTNLDLLTVLAFTWLFTAVAITAVFGPLLGLRGWFWLCMHHGLCLVGVGHEMRRGWHRHLRRRATDPRWQARTASPRQRDYW